MNKIKKMGVIVFTILITCNLLTGCSIGNDLSQDNKDYIAEKNLHENIDLYFKSDGGEFDYSEIKEVNKNSVSISKAGSDDINDYVNNNLNEGNNRKAFSVMIPLVYTIYNSGSNETIYIDYNCKAYYTVVYDFNTNEFVSTSFIPDKFIAEAIMDY